MFILISFIIQSTRTRTQNKRVEIEAQRIFITDKFDIWTLGLIISEYFSLISLSNSELFKVGSAIRNKSLQSFTIPKELGPEAVRNV